MTKSTITREHLQEIAEDGFLKHGESKELARMVLAAMDSEPVANAQLPISRERLEKIISWRSKYGENANVMLPAEEAAQLAAFAQYVLDAQPVADVVAWSHPQSERKCDIRWRQFDVHPGPLYSVPQPARVYPETLPCPVLIEPGLRFSAGIKTSTFLAALARRAVHESDLAALSPDEKEEVKERIEDFKKFITRPAPVVPEEKPMPNPLSMYAVDAVAAIAEVRGWNACRAAMLAGNEPVSSAYRLGQADDAVTTKSPTSNSPVIPDGWIPVSERMPEPNIFVLVSNGVWVGQGKHSDSDSFEDDERWQDEHGEFIDLLHHPVTHWMQLPTAPKQENI